MSNAYMINSTTFSYNAKNLVRINQVITGETMLRLLQTVFQRGHLYEFK